MESRKIYTVWSGKFSNYGMSKELRNVIVKELTVIKETRCYYMIKEAFNYSNRIEKKRVFSGESPHGIFYFSKRDCIESAIKANDRGIDQAQKVIADLKDDNVILHNALKELEKEGDHHDDG